jgi:hypothetical protein
LSRLRQYFHYQFNRLLAQGAGGQYLLLALVALFIVLLGINASFLGLFTPEALQAEGIDDDLGGGMIDSAWWSLKHVIDPGAFAEDYGAPWPVLLISLLLSVTGLAILGVLIAFITTSVQRRLELVKRGNTPVVEVGHTLILGWSKKVTSVLDFLSRTRRKQNVVILSPRGIEDMQDDLNLHFRPWRNLDVVLRSGPTHTLPDLERVGLASAGSVICVARASDEGRGETDIETIKTLMLLGGFREWDGPAPPMVAEITQKRNVEIANIAASRRIPLVSTSEIISKVIVQSARQPGISAVYGEIFSDGGNDLVVQSVPEAAGRTFAEVARWYPEAIPVGIAWQDQSRTVAALNPEPDYELAAGEQLVLMSPTANIKRHSTVSAMDEVTGGDSRKRTPRLERLLIIGWNENIDEILGELDAHAATDAVVTILSNRDEVSARAVLEEALDEDPRNLRIEYRRGNSIVRRDLETLPLEEYDAIVTLADESYGEDDPDARTIMSLLLLTDIGRSRRVPHVVSEIHEGANAELLSGTVARDVIVSPQIVSLQLAQISRQPVLGSIYRELLSAGGIECRRQPAGRYVSLDRPCTFEDLVVSAQRFAEVAVGVSRPVVSGSGPSGGLHLNPAKDTRWSLSDDDSIVVMAQQLFE